MLSVRVSNTRQNVFFCLILFAHLFIEVYVSLERIHIYLKVIETYYI